MVGLERPNTSGNSDFLSSSNELFTAAGKALQLKLGSVFNTRFQPNLWDYLKSQPLMPSSIPLFCIFYYKVGLFQVKKVLEHIRQQTNGRHHKPAHAHCAGRPCTPWHAQCKPRICDLIIKSTSELIRTGHIWRWSSSRYHWICKVWTHSSSCRQVRPPQRWRPKISVRH